MTYQTVTAAALWPKHNRSWQAAASALVAVLFCGALLLLASSGSRGGRGSMLNWFPSTSSGAPRGANSDSTGYFGGDSAAEAQHKVRSSPHNLLQADRWWLDQSPIEWTIQCYYPTSTTNLQAAIDSDGVGDDEASDRYVESSEYFCSRTLQINCRPSSVRAVYQNVVLRSASPGARQLTLSVRVSGDQLEAAAAASFMGLLAQVELRGGSAAKRATDFVSLEVDPSRLNSRSSDEPLLLTTRYRVPYDENEQNGEPMYIDSITVMAGCQGYVGSVLLSQIRAEAWTADGMTAVDGSPCRPEVVDRRQDDATAEGLSSPPQQQQQQSNIAINVSKPVYLLGEPHETGFSGGLRDDLSLVTQVSMDRLGVLEHTLDQWDMPVSLVIYAPLKAGLADDDWQTLYISKKVAAFKLHPASVVSLVYASNRTEQYPINALRNIAIRQAHSRFLLLADADFQPSPDLAARVLPLARSLLVAGNRPASSPSSSSPAGPGALVVPAFEYADVPHKSDVVAANKQELMQLIHAQGLVAPFRRRESPQSHAATDFWRWYTATEAFPVRLFSDKFEPYLVVEKNQHLPLYWEKFTGYGMNKISHMAELRVAGFTLWVVPDAWLIHVPHRLSTHFAEHLQNATYRLANRALRFEFLHHLRQKYHLNCSDERAL